MPIVTGAKPESSFSDPIGLLTDCHRRIERFLSALVQVSAEAQGGPLTSGQRASWETALRYFREAAPQHTADEEETLFPRLRRPDYPEMPAVLARVESLETEHGSAETIHLSVDRLGRLWLTSGSLTSHDAERLSALLAGLSDLYRNHIADEEGEVFPVAARFIPKTE